MELQVFGEEMSVQLIDVIQLIERNACVERSEISCMYILQTQNGLTCPIATLLKTSKQSW